MYRSLEPQFENILKVNRSREQFEQQVRKLLSLGEGGVAAFLDELAAAFAPWSGGPEARKIVLDLVAQWSMLDADRFHERLVKFRTGQQA